MYVCVNVVYRSSAQWPVTTSQLAPTANRQQLRLLPYANYASVRKRRFLI